MLKQSAASPHLLTHRGRAVVFEDHADLHKRIDDESVAIDENSGRFRLSEGPHARQIRGHRGPFAQLKFRTRKKSTV